MTRGTPRPFVVLTFSTTHDALDAEALLEDMGIDVVPIPAPPALSADCGIALRLVPEDADRAAKYLERAGIAVVRQASITDV